MCKKYFFDRRMAQGSMLLSLWPPAANRWIGPAPCPGTHPLSDHPVLGIELMVSHPCVMFPSAPRPTSPEVKGDFSSLDVNTQHQLLEIIEQYTLSNPPVEVREVTIFIVLLLYLQYTLYCFSLLVYCSNLSSCKLFHCLALLIFYCI